jgi:O-6-methylguanine DNA methyltransferase
LVRQVPAGNTLSYGEVAARLGKSGAARAVGQAMGRNPFPIIVPCHRILAANGKLGGFTANGGTDTKQKMLEIEGVQPGKSAKPKSVVKQAGHPFNARTALKHLRASDTQLAALILEAHSLGYLYPDSLRIREYGLPGIPERIDIEQTIIHGGNVNAFVRKTKWDRAASS